MVMQIISTILVLPVMLGFIFGICLPLFARIDLQEPGWKKTIK